MQNSQETTQTTTVYKTRINLISHLQAQGYNCDNYSEFSINETNAMIMNDQLDLLVTNDDTKKKIYVKYFLKKPLRPAYIYDFCSDLYEYDEILEAKDELMIIVNSPPNATLNDSSEHIWNMDNRFINIVCIQQLTFNIFENILVHKHIILSEEEEVVFRKKFHITSNSQIPEISRFDPVAKLIGIRPGQFCKIIRPSKTSIETFGYRFCI
jgi:DNA-directed RNA polymerase subunit H (RpoH/RPB5)